MDFFDHISGWILQLLCEETEKTIAGGEREEEFWKVPNYDMVALINNIYHYLLWIR